MQGQGSEPPRGPEQPWLQRQAKAQGGDLLRGAVVEVVLRWLLPIALAAVVVGGAVGGVIGHMTARRAVVEIVGPRDPDKPTVPGMGRLEVSSTPPGAQVVVDGRLVGVTPIPRVDLDPGRHAVVLNLAGYDPYTGAIAIEAGKAASLEAVLAQAIASGSGAAGAGGGGGGSAKDSTAGAKDDTGEAEAQSASEVEKPKKKARAAPPPRPRRDCSGERSTCRSHCDDAEWSCGTRCQYCGSCVSSMTWEQCNNICNTCKQGCKQNLEFCKSTCESNYDICEDSNNY